MSECEIDNKPVCFICKRGGSGAFWDEKKSKECEFSNTGIVDGCKFLKERCGSDYAYNICNSEDAKNDTIKKDCIDKLKRLSN